MSEPDRYAVRSKLYDIPLFSESAGHRLPFVFELELTERCNNNCRHCYINLPAEDHSSKDRELSSGEIEKIADQAVAMGTLFIVLTGGEPLLREDFEEIYLALRRKGLLVSVFTSGCLISDRIAKMFAKHPPFNLELTVYGVSERVYEKVTRTPGSYKSFMAAIDRLAKAGVPFRLKAMALKSNIGEMEKIKEFSERHTKDFFRYDYSLHLHYRRDEEKNRSILSERLSADEIRWVEAIDTGREEPSKRACEDRANAGSEDCGHLFQCGAGLKSFAVSPYGRFKLCGSMTSKAMSYDLRKGSLAEAWEKFSPGVLAMKSSSRDVSEGCAKCELMNLCVWCPAAAFLETGEADSRPEGYCQMAEPRAKTWNLDITPAGR